MEDCIIYGAGQYGTFAFEEYKEKYNVLFFVDADKKKHGQIKCNFIVKPVEILTDYVNTLVVVSVTYDTDAIMKRLYAMGMKNVTLYFEGCTDSHININDKYERSDSLLLIDCTRSTRRHENGGIPRVVKNVVKNISKVYGKMLPIMEFGGQTVTNGIFAKKYLRRDIDSKVMEIIAGDKYLSLDAVWSIDLKRILTDNREKGSESFIVIYDIIPINHPEVYTHGMAEHFRLSFAAALQYADNIITISNSVADDIADYFYKNANYRHKPLRLYVFPMGNDVICADSVNDKNVRPQIKKILAKKKIFLMVGTIEPRKGYTIVLEAMDKVAADVGLIVVGHDGWNNDKIKDSILKHDNVLWIDDASDVELYYCYEKAEALIQASKFEGYGLPLIEAAQFGLPIICSDIPVFHEVTQDHATFFKAGDSDSLAKVWWEWLNEKQHPDSRKIKIHTWKESAQEILDIVYGRTEPYKILQ